MKQIYSFLIIILLNFQLWATERPHEELLVVQTVSSDRRSFVITKGIKDGVTRGQEIIFSNENSSILCKAIEVNRDYSLWIPVNKIINIPFNKADIISYNSHAYGNVALDIVGESEKLNPEISVNNEFKKFRIDNNFSLKTSLDMGLSQSSSDVSADKNSTRSGYSFILEYNYRFLPEFEISSGVRLDNEVYRITNPQLDIPTKRILAIMATTYHFTAFSKDKNNFYLTVAAGLGKSSTTVNESASTGMVTLLPEIRLGYIMPISKSWAMLFEGSVDSLTAHEKFDDQSEQVTSILNAKLTIGLRF